MTDPYRYRPHMYVSQICIYLGHDHTGFSPKTFVGGWIAKAIYAHLNLKTNIGVIYCVCQTQYTRVYKCMHASCSWKLYFSYKVSSTAWFTNHFVGFCNYMWMEKTKLYMLCVRDGNCKPHGCHTLLELQHTFIIFSPVSIYTLLST